MTDTQPTSDHRPVIKINPADLLSKGIRLTPPQRSGLLSYDINYIEFTLEWNGAEYELHFEFDSDGATVPFPVGSVNDYGASDVESTVLTDSEGIAHEVLLALRGGVPLFAHKL